jgi:hypothetical protein
MKSIGKNPGFPLDIKLIPEFLKKTGISRYIRDGIM